MKPPRRKQWFTIVPRTGPVQWVQAWSAERAREECWTPGCRVFRGRLKEVTP